MTAGVPEAILRDLHASRAQLLAAIAGVSEEQFKRRPPAEAEAAAGAWSIAEVLAHLLASEQRRCDGLETMLAGGVAAATDPPAEERDAEARRGRAVPVPQIIHGLLAARRRLERALAEGDATGIPEAAERLLRQDVIGHERAHTGQIEAVKAVLPSRQRMGSG